MTLHHESRLVGILSHHVDDLMFSGDESGSLYQRAMGTVRAVQFEVLTSHEHHHETR